MTLHPSIFRDDYPENPVSFGDHVRKTRIDAGLQIKELAELIGVTENTILNWELHGKIPNGQRMERVRGWMVENDVQ